MNLKEFREITKDIPEDAIISLALSTNPVQREDGYYFIELTYTDPKIVVGKLLKTRIPVF